MKANPGKILVYSLSFLLVLLISCITTWEMAYAQGSTVEVRLEASKDSNAPLHTVPGTDEKYRFQSTPILTTADLTGAEAVSMGKSEKGGYVLRLNFSETGKKKLADITAKNKGKHLGFFVNGKLATAPPIKMTIRTSMVMLKVGAIDKSALISLSEKIDKEIEAAKKKKR